MVGKLREIERLRAFAVLLVVMHHLFRFKTDYVPELLREGGSGVDLFFVISGYVVGRSLLKTLPTFSEGSTVLERINRARPALHVFYLRRLYRIAPMAALWAIIPYELAKHWNASGAFGKPESVLHELFAIATLQYNYAMAYGNGGQLSYYWSLAVEEHFYLLLPVLMVGFGNSAARRMGVILLGMALVVLYARPYMEFAGPGEWGFAWRGFATHRKADFMFAGVFLYLCREQGWLEGPGHMKRWQGFIVSSLALLGVWASQGVLPDRQFWNGGQSVVNGLACVAVLLASYDRELVLGIPGVDFVLEWLGGRSYGIYLIHSTVLRALDELHHKDSHPPEWFNKAFDSSLWHAAMTVAATLALAELCYWAIERPFIKLGHRNTAAA